jgi:hypothetical protein
MSIIVAPMSSDALLSLMPLLHKFQPSSSLHNNEFQRCEPSFPTVAQQWTRSCMFHNPAEKNQPTYLEGPIRCSVMLRAQRTPHATKTQLLISVVRLYIRQVKQSRPKHRATNLSRNMKCDLHICKLHQSCERYLNLMELAWVGVSLSSVMTLGESSNVFARLAETTQVTSACRKARWFPCEVLITVVRS